MPGAAWKRWTAAAVAVVAAAAGLGWWLGSRRVPAAALLDRLPGENLLLLYLDASAARRAAALEPLLRTQIAPAAGYEAFIRETGFDYQRDLEAAAACYLADRVYLVARGRFDAARLRQYAVSQGGGCAGPGLDRPCWMPASLPGRKISLLLLETGLLGLANAPEQDAVLGLRAVAPPSAASLAQAAAQMNSERSLLWVTASAAGLQQAAGAGPSPNLALFARALRGAQRAYLFLNDRSPDLEISLQAVCASESQAAELRRLLQGLHDFLGGLSRGARGAKPASEWEKVLGSASIEQRAATVHAHWTLGRAMLEALGK